MTFSWRSHLPARDICAPRASFIEAYSIRIRFMYKHNSGNAGIHGNLIIRELWSHASNTGSTWKFLTFVLPELRFVYHHNTICTNYYRHWLPFGKYIYRVICSFFAETFCTHTLLYSTQRRWRMQPSHQQWNDTALWELMQSDYLIHTPLDWLWNVIGLMMKLVPWRCNNCNHRGLLINWLNKDAWKLLSHGVSNSSSVPVFTRGNNEKWMTNQPQAGART